MINKRLLVAAAMLPLMLGAWALTNKVTFDRSVWLADYAQLKNEMEHSYANLKWAGTQKNVDIVALNERTLQALNEARSAGQAKAALDDFLKAFSDGHLHIDREPPRVVAAIMSAWHGRSENKPLDLRATAQEACAALGFKAAANGPSIESSSVTAGGKRYGIIRIPLFSQYDYGAGCERAWPAFHKAGGGTCDEKCIDAFSDAAKYEVAGILAREARALAEVSPGGIVIDLTGNGGGTEWAEYAATALTPIEMKPPTVAFVRGPHWIESFDREIARLAAEPQTDAVRQDLAVARALRDSAAANCDLSGVWTQRPPASCWNIVPIPTSAVKAASQRPQAQPYSGRLFVMVDANTASASEYFTGILQDNKAATIIGTKTLGAGCGHTNGGIDVRLAHSGLKIEMPDCARLRIDGSNEYGGVTPDIVVDWGKSDAEKVAALQKVLTRL